MTKRPVTVWWGIPCKSAIPVFQALQEECGEDVMFIAVNDLPARRKRLGWSVPEHGKLPLEILKEDSWRERAVEVMDSWDGLHIVNGIYHDERIRFVASRLASSGRRFGVIMEAPSNLETGLKRIAKAAVAPVVTPLRTRSVAKQAEFVLSASGSRQREFESLGFAADRIFPFGYFPEFGATPRANGMDDALRILCVGYLEPFKGQDCLLKALAVLKGRRTPFECNITGFGSAAQSLAALCERLHLQDDVTFAGVVSDERLKELFAWANVLVAPGFEEPWGIRINEALLSGLPVVVSDGIGAKELIATSGAGEIFHAGSNRSLADALDRLLTRLRNDNTLLETVRLYCPLIAPRTAASYIANVIRHVEGVEYGERNSGRERPSPPWLARGWRRDAPPPAGASCASSM